MPRMNLDSPIQLRHFFFGTPTGLNVLVEQLLILFVVVVVAVAVAAVDCYSCC